MNKSALHALFSLSLGGIALGGVVLLSPATGCDSADCYATRQCGFGGAGQGGASSSSSTSSSMGAGGTGSGAGGGGANCDPTKGAVGATCGVFVSLTGKDTNAGTQEEPFATIGAGIAAAKGAAVYVCNEDFTLTDTLNVPSGTTLYGGLDCKSGWTWKQGQTSTVHGAADTIALVVADGAKKTSIDDLKVLAASATKAGGSSIAVLVAGGEVDFERDELVAGDAQPGAPGMSGGMQEAPAPPGGKGDDSSAGTNGGGTGSINGTCALQGGKGGDGGVSAGNANGQDGTAGDAGSGGTKGLGQNPGGGVPLCVDGGKGAAGSKPVSVEPGAMGLGAISATGYQGVAGSAGKDGTPGTSGGGGGGSMFNGKHGAGGGGGGAGGCGGLHGEGGAFGGSSLGLVAIAAKVTLQDCTVSAAKAGDGGVGGDKQFGQPGGKAGLGGTGTGGPASACDGGKGGDGGDGGNGGGGLGGHSIGIAYTKTAPTLKNTTPTPGTKGAGGKGGNLDADGNHGQDGVAVAVQAFP